MWNLVDWSRIPGKGVQTDKRGGVLFIFVQFFYSKFSPRVCVFGGGGGGGSCDPPEPLWIRHILVRLGPIFHIRLVIPIVLNQIHVNKGLKCLNKGLS